MGTSSLQDFLQGLMKLGADILLVNTALDNIGKHNLSFTSCNVPADGAVFLVSGWLKFILDWNLKVSNPLLVICDEHIRGQKMRLGAAYDGCSYITTRLEE
jgi:hypothetical protein